MNSNVDTFLKIGDSHKVCEDYVLCGDLPDSKKYLIVSDGCSGSENTEMGSRILAHTAKKFIIDHFKDRNAMPFPKQSYMGTSIIHMSKLTADMLYLDTECLDATLVIGILDPERNWFRVYLYGDGVIVTRNEDDQIKIIENEFSSVDGKINNAPYYLSYQLDARRMGLYHAMRMEQIIRTRVFRPDGQEKQEYGQMTQIADDAQQYAYDFLSPIILDRSTDKYKTILLCSDGFSSFIQPGDNGMEPSNPLITAQEFTAFKNIRGQFLKRRVKRALRDLEQNYGSSHYDDLSVAGITFFEE